MRDVRIVFVGLDFQICKSMDLRAAIMKIKTIGKKVLCSNARCLIGKKPDSGRNER
jgi:hypothetical protein